MSWHSRGTIHVCILVLELEKRGTQTRGLDTVWAKGAAWHGSFQWVAPERWFYEWK